MPPRESQRPVESRFEARLLLRISFGMWLLAALACVWEVLAMQPPDSPLHVGVLASPVAQLRGFTFGLGCVGAVMALSWERLYEAGRGRAVALTFVLGALLHTAALSYAAARGLLAIQAFDPRPDARYTLYVRTLAHALTMLSVAVLSTRALRAGPRPVAELDQRPAVPSASNQPAP